MENYYRNQLTTKQKIAMVGSIQITTKDEAVQFLQAISNINMQIARVIRGSVMADLAALNRAEAAKEVKAAEETPEPTPEVPADEPVEVPNFAEEETHTADDAKKRIDTLKKAKKSK